MRTVKSVHYPFGPAPRLRIYTEVSHYVRVLYETAVGRARKGDAVEEAESAVAKRAGTRHAVAMPMARTAIYLTIKNIIKPGDEVILSPYTIADVVSMVICAGGVPVFADIERETCNIDPAAIEAAISPRTGAVLVTHFYGLMCDMPRIVQICRRHGLPLIEDAAQVFGGRLNGIQAGAFADAGIYSFGMYKNVNAFYGGMVVTNNDALRDRLARDVQRLPYYATRPYLRKVLSAAVTDVVTLPLFFRNLFFWFFRYAYLNDIDAINNKMRIDVDPKMHASVPPEYLYRMTSLQARLIVGQLHRVESDMRLRIEAAKRYHEGMKDIEPLILPPLREDGSHTYWYFPIQYDDRRALVSYALKHRRDITESYHRNCAELPCFSAFAKPCPNASATARSLVYLPTYPRYSADEIDRTIDVIRRFFHRQ